MWHELTKSTSFLAMTPLRGEFVGDGPPAR